MNIYQNLANVQQALKAPKDQRNNFGNYNYRSCESILEAVKPLLAKNGLALTLTDEMIQVGERIYVKATATVFPTDASGENAHISVDAFAREEENKKGMDSSQVTGAASSYARKYALNGLFCIDDNKDSDATNTHGKETQESADNMRFTCEECGKPLTSYIGSDGKTVAIRKHAEGSKKKFGKVLCLDCIGKLNES